MRPSSPADVAARAGSLAVQQSQLAHEVDGLVEHVNRLAAFRRKALEEVQFLAELTEKSNVDRERLRRAILSAFQELRTFDQEGR